MRFHRALLVVVLALASLACAQEQAGLETYVRAIKEPDPYSQAAQLERYLADASSSALRRDALTVAAFDYARLADRSRAADKARQVLAIDSKDPIAIAILLDADAYAEKRVEARSRVIQAASSTQLRRPEGMRQIDFAILQQYVWRSLTGHAGLTFVELKDYESAARFLEPVVAATPDDARYIFGLGNALRHLKGRDAEAFWYLARAVDLSAASPQGKEIAQYAWDEYQRAGGKEKDWQGFLAAANAPRQSMAPVVDARRSGPPVAQTPAQSTVAANRKPSKAERKRAEEEAEAALYRDPNPPREKVEPLKPRPPITAPLSLGILIQTARLTPDYRKSIVFTLSDLVRHLRRGDEAFILAYSNQLDFVQDLTDNNVLLEDALDHLKPAKGAALFDAVSFAAGHMKRVAKNENRVLLVISDGSAVQGQASSYDVSQNLNAVRVDCIGVNVTDPGQRQLLRNLSHYSNGQTTFIDTPPDFRNSTHELAQQMGISFPK